MIHFRLSVFVEELKENVSCWPDISRNYHCLDISPLLVMAIPRNYNCLFMTLDMLFYTTSFVGECLWVRLVLAVGLGTPLVINVSLETLRGTFSCYGMERFSVQLLRG